LICAARERNPDVAARRVFHRTCCSETTDSKIRRRSHRHGNRRESDMPTAPMGK
jgi:hypothetical protein